MPNCVFENKKLVRIGSGRIITLFTKTQKARKLTDVVCFPKGEKVYTENRGVEAVENIQIGTRLYGNTVVQKVFKREFDGRCIAIKPKYFPEFTVTASHPILVREMRRTKVYSPRRNVNVWGEPHWLPASVLLDNPERFFVGVGIGEQEEQEIGIKLPGGQNELSLTPDLAYLLGWYVADGCCSFPSPHVILYLNPEADKKHIPRLTAIVENILNRKINLNYKNPSLRLTFSLKAMHVFLKQNFGKSACEKRLPWWLFKANASTIGEFMKGYLHGDGWTDGNLCCISTCSEILARQLQLLLLRIGQVAYWSESQAKNKMIDGRRLKDSVSYRLHWRNTVGRKHWLLKQGIVWVRLFRTLARPYKGLVYNFQTSTGTISTPVITHNCPHFYELKWAGGCIYNCAYCYLMGTFRFRAWKRKDRMVTPKFKERKDIERAVMAFINCQEEPSTLNTGELSDSLMQEAAKEPFSEFIMPLFEGTKHKVLFLSKGTNVKHFLKNDWQKNAILSWSINSVEVSKKFEKLAPNPLDRIKAARKVFERGYEVRFRLDPMVPVLGWEGQYKRIITAMFEGVKPTVVTLGTLRGLPATLAVAVRKDWVKYLTEKSSWGRKPGLKIRLEMYRFAIQEMRKHRHRTIGVCKDTLQIHKLLEKEFGMNHKTMKCNCIR